MAPKPLPPEPSGPTVVLRWKGDDSCFTNGVPNRDVTVEDALEDELVAEAVASGTHERV